jgi:hypothetical protein
MITETRDLNLDDENGEDLHLQRRGGVERKGSIKTWKTIQNTLRKRPSKESSSFEFEVHFPCDHSSPSLITKGV